MAPLRRLASSALLVGGLLVVFASISAVLDFSGAGMVASLALIAALLYAGGVWFGSPPSIIPPAGADRVIVFDRALRVAAGFRVSVARTGFEAIVKASCLVPDLILLDDLLPDIGSSETGRLLTTCPVTSHIPIVRLLPGRRVPRRMLMRLRGATV